MLVNRVRMSPDRSRARSGEMKHANDDSATLSMEDMAVMQENVVKYQREEIRPEEDIETEDESTILDEEDAYVKKLRAAMEAKATE